MSRSLNVFGPFPVVVEVFWMLGILRTALEADLVTPLSSFSLLIVCSQCKNSKPLFQNRETLEIDDMLESLSLRDGAG